jgi:hypothetical protein
MEKEFDACKKCTYAGPHPRIKFKKTPAKAHAKISFKENVENEIDESSEITITVGCLECLLANDSERLTENIGDI